jgi:hypothetical protein
MNEKKIKFINILINKKMEFSKRKQSKRKQSRKQKQSKRKQSRKQSKRKQSRKQKQSKRKQSRRKLSRNLSRKSRFSVDEKSKQQFEYKETEFLYDYINKIEYKIIKNNERLLLNIGGNYLEWNWSNIKTLNEDKLKKYAASRNKFVDILIEDIFKFYTDDCKSKCKATPSGSVADANIYSDYDLTISGHFKVSEMIQTFNSIIYSVFGLSTFEALDTNLYGYSYILPTNNLNHSKTWTQSPLNSQQSILLSDNDKILEQDKWVYRRLLSFLSNLKMIRMENQEENQWYEMNTLDKNQSKNYLKYMKIFEQSMYANSDDELNNKCSEKECLSKVKNELIDNLSHMNYYGDETYFSQGAFLHVVGTMFYYSKNDVNDKLKIIKPYMLIHSMIENMAYFIHSFEHKKDIFYSVKYYHRFLDAFYLLCKLKGLENLISLLQPYLDLLSVIKIKYRNASDKNIEEYEKTNSIVGKTASELKKGKVDDMIEKIKHVYQQMGLKKDINPTNENIWLIFLLDILIFSINKDINKDITNITIKENNGVYSFNIS